VYQLGRGSDPVIVVGRIFPAVAFNIYVCSYATFSVFSDFAERMMASVTEAP
jgi:hypothetical protein